MPLRTSTTVVVAVLTICAANAHAQDHDHGVTDKLGTVVFSNSCSNAAQPHFNRAIALLHSFEFSRALAAFATTLKTDPACAMAEWGIAVSRWGNPFGVGIRPAALLQQGRAAVERARSIGLKTDREHAYADAVALLYDDSARKEQSARMQAFRDALATLATRFPDDTEAAIFAALWLSAAASPSDTTFADQRKAGETLERLIAKQPEHPGLAHYIIHSYDFPPLADRAIEAARRYAKIAPSAPHALHMPSHTFTRLGHWQESIETNIAAAVAAKRDGVVAEELHTMDYRVYAYLQSAQDQQARRILDALPEVESRFDPDVVGSAAPGSAGVFALAAIPARYALERGAWADAARLQVKPSKFPYTDALTHFARALGAARIGDVQTVRASIDALQGIQRQLTQANEFYWAQQAEIQRRSAAAWLALAEGRKTEALAAMREAAALEDSSEKAAVTPGPLAPARELLAEMLMEMNEPAQALAEFEATLKKEPNRFRAVSGAARAAARKGDRTTAARYYELLIMICARAETPERSELAEARRARQ